MLYTFGSAYLGALESYHACRQVVRRRRLQYLRKGLIKKIEYPVITPERMRNFVDLLSFVMKKLQVYDDIDVYFIGSCIENPETANDLDILINYKPGRAKFVSWEKMEKLLWCLKRLAYQLLLLKVDPFVQFENERVKGGPLLPDTRLTTWTLESRQFTRRILNETLIDFRRVGLVSLVYSATAMSTNYYTKLPFDESGARILRPGIHCFEYA